MTSSNREMSTCELRSIERHIRAIEGKIRDTSAGVIAFPKSVGAESRMTEISFHIFRPLV